MVENMITLGLETSCDETAVAVVEGRFNVLSSIVASQDEIHAKYGGIVPELACRRHVEMIRPLVKEALTTAGITLDRVGLVSATRGPGLVGALLVGLSYAKALAWARKLPFAGVNHLEGHVMSAFVQRPDTPLPAVALLVSGGHTELFLVERIGELAHLGGTRDDAVGEAFDKVAKMLSLGYPGGPVVEKMAEQGAPVYNIPVAMANANTLDFSFSGPKTAVKQLIKKLEKEEGGLNTANICASFQRSAVDALVLKTGFAIEKHNPASILIVGGVASNGALRRAMSRLGEERSVDVVFPSPELCTDNAVMIASAGACSFLDDPQNRAWRDYLTLDADPSWMPGILNITESRRSREGA
ncbi:N(6)-L-threonylcarbamoyladenine synthase [hydrothermal vent metagenome]|uniref:N(6)-L-threonylcarbamoyladenine synthase n=1 Tax=hydrothermal vent metagenome TaxID=652676 RepID=A0A3B1C2E4_9ZZZZ